MNHFLQQFKTHMTVFCGAGKYTTYIFLNIVHLVNDTFTSEGTTIRCYHIFLRHFFFLPPIPHEEWGKKCHFYNEMGLWNKTQRFPPPSSVSYRYTRQARHGVCCKERSAASAQVPLQNKTGSNTRQVQSKHSGFVLESLMRTQAPSGSCTVLLFVRTNMPSGFCLLLHTLKTTEGFCTAPLRGTGMDCAPHLEVGRRLVLIHLSVG